MWRSPAPRASAGDTALRGVGVCLGQQSVVTGSAGCVARAPAGSGGLLVVAGASVGFWACSTMRWSRSPSSRTEKSMLRRRAYCSILRPRRAQWRAGIGRVEGIPQRMSPGRRVSSWERSRVCSSLPALARAVATSSTRHCPGTASDQAALGKTGPPSGWPVRIGRLILRCIRQHHVAPSTRRTGHPASATSPGHPRRSAARCGGTAA